MTVDRRRCRGAEPRRRDRRRGDRLHRGDDRGVHRGGAVRSGAHRGDRPQARHRERRALSLRARPRSGLRPGRAGDRDAADARAVRRRGVRGRRRPARCPIGGGDMCCAPSGRRASAGSHVPHEESAEILDGARLRGRDASRAAISRSSRRPGAATSSARPISSRRCCGSRATTRSRRCRSNARRRCRGRR